MDYEPPSSSLTIADGSFQLIWLCVFSLVLMGLYKVVLKIERLTRIWLAHSAGSSSTTSP